MRLWRISDHVELDGGGGLQVSGRWHTRGRRIVYCAPNPGTSLVEALVHMELGGAEMPAVQFLEIEAPETVSSETADADEVALENGLRTRDIGDDWLRSGRTALLLVPSVVVPATFNVLVNPDHPESQRLRVIRIHARRLDPRLRKAA